MTPFEQAVADALRTIELSDGIPLAAEDAELLAPRVAAALTASIQAWGHAHHEEVGFEWHTAALATLQGTQ